jgi:hypothetical protein
MTLVPSLFRAVLPVLLAATLPALAAQPAAPATLRVDLVHTGNA